MTETQINHRAPLAPGEIRKHTVGATTFRVMHVAGGSFTQVIYSINGQPVVICGTTWERIAVRAYADAIEQAESDRIDALDDADGMSFDASGSYVTDEPFGGMLPTPEPGSLSALIDAYGEAMARGGIELASGRTVQDGIAAAVAHTTRADALKAEILGRFGGER